MKKKTKTSLIIVISIFALIALCLYILSCLNVNFDKNFWTNFFQNLIPNLVVIGFALLILDRIIENQRSQEIKSINRKYSQHVKFLLERLSIKILDFLDIKKIKDFEVDVSNKWTTYPNSLKEFNQYLKSSEIQNKLIQKFQNSKRKSADIKKFIKILQTEADGIADTLKKIYPMPDSKILKIFEEDIIQLSAFLSVFEAMKKTSNSKKMTQNQKREIKKLFKNHSKTLIRINYMVAHQDLTEFLGNILYAAKKAKNNALNANI